MTPNPISQRNLSNAQHSTGPRTPEGKAKVSQNARKLGLFVSDSTAEQEDPSEFADLLAGYTSEYCPLTCSESELVRQITVASHRLRRLDRIETAAMFTEEIAHTRHEGSVILGERFTYYATVIEKIERARMRAERSFGRCYKELETRKRNRPYPRVPPAEVAVEVDTRHHAVPNWSTQNKPSHSDPTVCQTPVESTPINPPGAQNTTKDASASPAGHKPIK